MLETEEKKEEQFEECSNPLSSILWLAFESSLKSTSDLTKLINDYEKKGENAIPIVELKKVIVGNFKEAVTSKDGLFSRLLNI